MTPPLVTLRPALETVVTKVTAPVLLATAREPGSNVLDAAVVVTPDVGEVWVSTLVTVSVYDQTPVSPLASLSVPEIV
jgi:hypothetical protein